MNDISSAHSHMSNFMNMIKYTQLILFYFQLFISLTICVGDSVSNWVSCEFCFSITKIFISCNEFFKEAVFCCFLAGEKIVIDQEPASPSIMKENVEKILQFISARKIRLHHVTAKGAVFFRLEVQEYFICNTTQGVVSSHLYHSEHGFLY